MTLRTRKVGGRWGIGAKHHKSRPYFRPFAGLHHANLVNRARRF